MLHKSIVSKFTKAGLKNKQTHACGKRKWYMAANQGRSVAWYEEEGQVRNIHSPSIYSDNTTECGDDIFFETIDHALCYLMGHEVKNKNKANKS